jgi:actin-related protein 9
VINGADVEMGGTGEAKADDNDEELIELPDDDEGAIYPLKGRLSLLEVLIAGANRDYRGPDR